MAQLARMEIRKQFSELLNWKEHFFTLSCWNNSAKDDLHKLGKTWKRGSWLKEDISTFFLFFKKMKKLLFFIFDLASKIFLRKLAWIRIAWLLCTMEFGRNWVRSRGPMESWFVHLLAAQAAWVWFPLWAKAACNIQLFFYPVSITW